MGQTSPNKRVKKQLIDEYWYLNKIPCFYCQRPQIREIITLEHIVPVTCSGATKRRNCELVCYECNQLRSMFVTSILELRDFSCRINKCRPKKRRKHISTYKFHVERLCRLLVHQSDRLKINFDDAMSLIENIHQKNMKRVPRGVREKC
jgi:hypothetical protein